MIDAASPAAAAGAAASEVPKGHHREDFFIGFTLDPSICREPGRR